MKTLKYSFTAYGIAFGILVGLTKYDIKGAIIGLCIGLGVGYTADLICHIIERAHIAKINQQKQIAKKRLKEERLERMRKRKAEAIENVRARQLQNMIHSSEEEEAMES